MFQIEGDPQVYSIYAKPARRLDHPTGEPQAVSHATDASSSPFSPADDGSSSGSIVDTTRRSAGEATDSTAPPPGPTQPSQDKATTIHQFMFLPPRV